MISNDARLVDVLLKTNELGFIDIDISHVPKISFSPSTSPTKLAAFSQHVDALFSSHNSSPIQLTVSLIYCYTEYS